MIQTGIERTLKATLLTRDELQQNNAKTLRLDHSLLGEHFDFPFQIGIKLKISGRICLVNKLDCLINLFSERTGFEVHFVTGFYGHYGDERLSPFLERMPHTE